MLGSMIGASATRAFGRKKRAKKRTSKPVGGLAGIYSQRMQQRGGNRGLVSRMMSGLQQQRTQRQANNLNARARAKIQSRRRARPKLFRR